MKWLKNIMGSLRRPIKSKTEKWTYDPETKVVTIYENDEYQLGTQDSYVTIVVQVGVKDGSKNVSKESRGKAE